MNNVKINLSDLKLPDNTDNLRNFSVKIDKSINNKLHYICAVTGIKKGLVVRKLVSYALPKMKIVSISLDSLEGKKESKEIKFELGEQFSFRIAEEDYNTIQSIKNNTDMNQNIIVNSCLQYSLERIIVNTIQFD